LRRLFEELLGLFFIPLALFLLNLRQGKFRQYNNVGKVIKIKWKERD